jgi:DNA-3-methyladenine glycosylase I
MARSVENRPVPCPWPGTDPLYLRYHDEEWGVPVHDDRRLFEMLVLEGAQAGLSWITILRKRDAYGRAFARFDIDAVARFGRREIRSLLANPGIVRNRLKIEGTVKNARAALAVRREFGSLDAYLWQFVGGAPIVNHPRTLAEVPARTAESDAMSRDLKRRGFTFVGSTICYAFMQATGMVNDHLVTCPFREARTGAGGLPPAGDPGLRDSGRATARPARPVRPSAARNPRADRARSGRR